MATSPQTLHPATQWLWRVLVTATLLSMMGFGLAAWILSRGAADPISPDLSLRSDTALIWAGGNDFQSLAADQTLIFTSPELLSLTEFSVNARAMVTSDSDTISAWGIWLQDADGKWLIVAINGAGYVTARLCPAEYHGLLETCDPLQEPSQKIFTFWKTFRFILPSGEINTIHLEYAPQNWQDGLTLRLNAEWMWDIPFQLSDDSVTWGLWARGGSEMASKLRWLEVQFSPASQ